MYRGLSVIAISPVLDEEEKIRHVVQRTSRPLVDEVLVVDDGSTDGSAEAARQEGARAHSMGRVAGVGAAIRAGYGIAIKVNPTSTFKRFARVIVPRRCL